MHAVMATLRAVENGFVLVRPTAGGRTIAIDATGRETTWVEKDGVPMADIVLADAQTLYAKIGDLFAWICLAGFLLAGGTLIMSGHRIASSNRPRHAESSLPSKRLGTTAAG